jgi:hypothetical protein
MGPKEGTLPWSECFGFEPFAVRVLTPNIIDYQYSFLYDLQVVPELRSQHTAAHWMNSHDNY